MYISHSSIFTNRYCVANYLKKYFISFTEHFHHEEGVVVDIENEHQQRILLNEYQSKLKAEGKSVPDPLDLMNRWKGEEHMTIWPKLYLTSIIHFYDTVLCKCHLIQRIECEYEQCKAYHYYTNSRIGEVKINLDGNSKFCLFLTNCLHSQCVLMRQTV